jgi:hypothetical protein
MTTPVTARGAKTLKARVATRIRRSKADVFVPRVRQSRADPPTDIAAPRDANGRVPRTTPPTNYRIPVAPSPT